MQMESRTLNRWICPFAVGLKAKHADRSIFFLMKLIYYTNPQLQCQKTRKIRNYSADFNNIIVFNEFKEKSYLPTELAQSLPFQYISKNYFQARSQIFQSANLMAFHHGRDAMTQAYIAATGIALPTKVDTEQFLEIDQRMRARHGQSREIRDKIKSFVENAQIKSRHSVCPGWYKENEKDNNTEDIFTPFDFDPPAHMRAKFWHEQAPKLAVQAAKNAIAQWKGNVSEITHVVTTSTSGWAEPGIAVELIEQLGLSLDTRKIEININGCFCGASCLRTARDIVKGGESGAVLVVAVELSSVQYNIADTDVSTLISSSLFSDGAGAVIVAPKGPFLFQEAGMSLVPNSKHMLRLHPDFEKESNASKMFLHQGVSKALAQYFAYDNGQKLIDHLLSTSKKTPHLAVHPGGPNILDALQGVFIERGWPQNCLNDSYAVLQQVGNLGSAAMLFVLHRVLTESCADDVAYFAFGPGVTVEWGSVKFVG